MAVKTRGGKRPNAGRKTVPDKKVSLFIYVPGSYIEALGDTEAKRIAEAAVSRAAKKIIQK